MDFFSSLMLTSHFSLHHSHHLSMLFSPYLALLGLAASAFAAPASSTPGSKAVRTLRRFPGQWTESLAVRKSGPIVVSLLSRPEIWQVDPDTRQGVLVARFPAKLGALGITETEPDVFAVAVGNFSTVTGSVANPNASTIYTVDVRRFNARTGRGARVTKVVDMPDAVTLNGATTLDASRGLVYFSDSELGLVWLVDTKTGRYSRAIEDPAFLPPPGPVPFGIDGIRVVGNTLYWSNIVSGVFGSVGINADGSASGAAEPLISNVPIDDFALAPAAPGQQPTSAYAVTNSFGNCIVRLDFAARTSTLVAGGINSTLVPGGTALLYGRRPSDKHLLYGTTAGVFNGTNIGGMVFSFDPKKL